MTSEKHKEFSIDIYILNRVVDMSTDNDYSEPDMKSIYRCLFCGKDFDSKKLAHKHIEIEHKVIIQILDSFFVSKAYKDREIQKERQKVLDELYDFITLDDMNGDRESPYFILDKIDKWWEDNDEGQRSLKKAGKIS